MRVSFLIDTQNKINVWSVMRTLQPLSGWYTHANNGRVQRRWIFKKNIHILFFLNTHKMREREKIWDVDVVQVACMCLTCIQSFSPSVHTCSPFVYFITLSNRRFILKRINRDRKKYGSKKKRMKEEKKQHQQELTFSLNSVKNARAIKMLMIWFGSIWFYSVFVSDMSARAQMVVLKYT